MRRRVWALTLPVVAAALVMTGSALAQGYTFTLDQERVDVYWESDGSLRLEYVFIFTNDASAPTIEYVDVGIPTDAYDLGSISATANGVPVTHVAESPYVTPGVEIGLGGGSIPPGGTGTVRVSIGRVERVLFEADEPAGYASARFSPTWFDSESVHGSTDLTVTFHLPPGVQPEEPRWYASPSGWQSEPSTGFDADGRIIYQWRNPSASGSDRYDFGAAFPAGYVPAGAIRSPTVMDRTGIAPEALTFGVCALGVGLFIAFWVWLSINLDRRRKLAYLPPKISIEGHGIKRGLTAVEAAVLLETPLDRVLTMTLFSLVKKNAARVVTEEPLRVDKLDPLPEDLRDYELAFLEAAAQPDSRPRQLALQKVVIELVKAVQQKMKGFSLRESRDYYRAIVDKAWKQVEEAGTPEVRSQRLDENLEWTMLDRDFEGRTRRTFQTGPVFVPVWWGNFRPSYGGAPRPALATGRVPTTGPSVSLPRLPGSDFAASLVRSVQNTAGGLVSNLTNFTSGVTNRTNPPPPPPRASGGRGGFSSGGGSCACACACACAGCACACAGGGR